MLLTRVGWDVGGFTIPSSKPRFERKPVVLNRVRAGYQEHTYIPAPQGLQRRAMSLRFTCCAHALRMTALQRLHATKGPLRSAPQNTPCINLVRGHACSICMKGPECSP
eukprot:366550-Chlamydomonas_euryale.AAC.5